MKFFTLNSNFKNSPISIYTIVFTIIWYIIFGINLSIEPYIWDDLHFFRQYSSEELKNIWIGNWDSDGIETPSYRPIAVLYYHYIYLVFGENTFLLRHFVILMSFVLIIISSKLLKKLNFNNRAIIYLHF